MIKLVLLAAVNALAFWAVGVLLADDKWIAAPELAVVRDGMEVDG